jgi:hypothetical protein
MVTGPPESILGSHSWLRQRMVGRPGSEHPHLFSAHGKWLFLQRREGYRNGEAPLFKAPMLRLAADPADTRFPTNLSGKHGMGSFRTYSHAAIADTQGERRRWHFVRARLRRWPQPTGHHTLEGAHVAVRDALQRQLEDHTRCQHGEVKPHAAPEQ